MRTVLIHTVRNDAHAKIVAKALNKRGNRVITWLGENYPLRANVSVIHVGKEAEAIFRSDEVRFNGAEIDVVWNRRRMLPQVPASVDARDVDFSFKELQTAFASHDLYFSNAFWINNEKSTVYSDLKMMQLIKAQKVGMCIPKTLISNDPLGVRKFVGQTSQCIYKSLNGHVWHEDGKRLSTYTARIHESALVADAALQAVPGIYQEMIQKSFEVRAQFFGNYYAAIKINSLGLKEGDLDWRIGQNEIESCEAILLPHQIYKSCLNLMCELDIVSGGFDFIVDIEGNWIFLEVNEAGQFLFIEEWCRQLHLLDAFCQFVEKMDMNFQYTESASPIDIADFYEEVAAV